MAKIINVDLKKGNQSNEVETNKGQWKPEIGEHYYFAEFVLEEYSFIPTEEVQGVEDSDTFNFPIFKTINACQSYCTKLNEAISQIEP